jgi:hypothetical protein
MLSELCRELKNWFDRGQPRLIGDFEIAEGRITSNLFNSKIQNGQYFRIIGSVFNDGVHCFNEQLSLKDETFHGALWLMAVPQEILDLSDEIDAWIAKYATIDSAAMSPFNSESFGGYSYSKGSVSGSNGVTYNPGAWQSVFANRLNRWRKI